MVGTVTGGRLADGGLVGGTHAQSVDSCRAAIGTAASTQLNSTAARLQCRTLAPIRVVTPRCAQTDKQYTVHVGAL